MQQPPARPSVLRLVQRHRVALAVVAPVVALVAFGSWVVVEKLERYRAAKDMMSVAVLMRAGHTALHEIQDERSLSALAASGGDRQELRSALDNQRRATDQGVERLNQVLAQHRVQALFGRERPDPGLDRLVAVRAGVDGGAPLRQVLEGYNELTDRLGGVTARLAANTMGNGVAAFMDLGLARDRLVREYEIGTAWMGAGRADRALMDLFVGALGEQRAFMESFRGHASQSSAELLDRIAGTPVMEQLDRLHQRALQGRLRPSDADAWENAHRTAVAQLHDAEEQLASELEGVIRAELAATRTTFYVVAGVVLVLVAFSLETLRRSERRAVLAEEEARKLFRAVEQSPVSVMMTDGDGLVEYVNPAFTRMTGYGRDDVLGRNPRLLRSGVTPAGVYRDMWAAIKGGQEWRGEICNRRKDGSLYWESMTIAPVKNAAGEVEELIALKEDVSEVKDLRSALEREHANMVRLLESLPDPIALIAPNGRFEYVNRALAAEFGEVAGRGSAEYFLALDGAIPILPPHGWPPGCDTRRGEWRAGRIGKTYELTETPVDGADGRMLLLQLYHDITGRKQAEEAMTAARIAAEAANRAKTEFLAAMSHELRTPLNAIIGFSEIIEAQLLGPVGQEQYVEYARDINTSGRHLLQMITDILDVSCIEVGRLTLREEQVDLRAAVASCLALVRDRAELGRVAVEAQLPAEVPALWADMRRVKQMLVNVVGNAVKFTRPGGRVEVRVERAAGGGLALVVADTGIGIQGADLAKVMEPFSQADQSLARPYEGSGLGLPLTRRLMALHGGTLTLDSEPGVGTTVRLTFPPERVRETAAV